MSIRDSFPKYKKKKNIFYSTFQEPKVTSKCNTNSKQKQKPSTNERQNRWKQAYTYWHESKKDILYDLEKYTIVTKYVADRAEEVKTRENSGEDNYLLGKLEKN